MAHTIYNQTERASRRDDRALAPLPTEYRSRTPNAAIGTRAYGFVTGCGLLRRAGMRGARTQERCLDGTRIALAWRRHSVGRTPRACVGAAVALQWVRHGAFARTPRPEFFGANPLRTIAPESLRMIHEA